MAESQAPAAPAKTEPNHGLRIFLIWVVLALAADLLIWFVWYPHLPPGRMSLSAQHQQFDIAVLGLAAAPVMIFVWTYFGYTLVNWRHRDGDDEDGPPIFGHTGLPATTCCRCRSLPSSGSSPTATRSSAGWRAPS